MFMDHNMTELYTHTKFYQNSFKTMFADRMARMHTKTTKSITSLVAVITLISGNVLLIALALHL